MKIMSHSEKFLKFPLVGSEHVDGAGAQPSKSRQKSTWLTTVLIGIAVASCVLIANISLLIWASNNARVRNGSVALFEGKWNKSRTPWATSLIV